jgi:hypothetical protein
MLQVIKISEPAKMIWFIMICLFVVSSPLVAQTEEEEKEEVEIERLKYFGYSLSAGTQSYGLSSDYSRLDGLRVTREGGSVGAIIGNSKLAVKSTLGLFYSSPSIPYSIDVLEVGLAGQFYFLRFKNDRSHAIEPYFSIASKGIRSGFYGNFSETRVKRNNSVSEEFVGAVNSVQGFVGLGAEYQLQSESLHFLHFFVEARYGSTLYNQSRSEALSNTFATDAMSLVVGVNFGRIKYKSNGKGKR